MPRPENANSVMLVRPIGMNPAARRRAIAVAPRVLAIDLQEGARTFSGRVLDAFQALVDQRPARLAGFEPRGDLVQRRHGVIGFFDLAAGAGGSRMLAYGAMLKFQAISDFVGRHRLISSPRSVGA